MYSECKASTSPLLNHVRETVCLHQFVTDLYQRQAACLLKHRLTLSTLLLVLLGGFHPRCPIGHSRGIISVSGSLHDAEVPHGPTARSCRIISATLSVDQSETRLRTIRHHLRAGHLLPQRADQTRS
jgi:hypothetical protein